MHRHTISLLTLGIIWLSSAAIPTAGWAQVIDQAEEKLGLGADEGSLAVWRQPTVEENARLGAHARLFERGVMLVGHPRFGRGTAWVVSRQHRLLATNAHVADIMYAGGGKMYAVVNGTAVTYEVERVWYHPGVVRRLTQGNGILARSTDPSVGNVHANSPDVALMQLTSDGADLDLELPMATPSDMQKMFAQPIAMIGFPGHDTSSWPRLGERAAATYRAGVVSRLSDFRYNGSAPFDKAQYIQHTATSWGGFSGSPLLLSNGRVVALHNSSRTVKRGEVQTALPHGIRIDCLWELLAWHDLDDKVELPVDRASINLVRYQQPDPNLEKYQEALELTRRAADLIDQQDFKDAAAHCNEALKLVPNLAIAFGMRARVFMNYASVNVDRISEREFLRQHQFAADDVQRYLKLVPGDVKGYVLYAGVLNNIAAVTPDSRDARLKGGDVLMIVEQLLARKDLPGRLQADLWDTRASATYNLGDYRGAEDDHNMAIRLAPNEPAFWINRARYWQNRGRPSLARADFAQARRIMAERRVRAPEAGGRTDDDVRRSNPLEDGGFSPAGERR